MIIIDNAGYQFIDSCNENHLFKSSKMDLKWLNFESDTEGVDYDLMLKKTKREYNKQDGKICFKQVFTSDYIRRANEHLQACIDHKKIWFASRASANSSVFDKYANQKVSLKHVNESSVSDFIETQDSLIYQVKKQCALIEVKSTARGNQTFDLPLHLKKDGSQHRARRDNYTTLMLATWATKCYFDMQEVSVEANTGFSPRMIG